MRPRIALATYEQAPLLAPDDMRLIPALADVGIDAEPAVWSDAAVIWETFDAVLVRSCWDYHRRFTEFVEWLERLDASRIPVWNSIDLIGWNAHKRYLVDLAERGVSVTPTRIVPRGHGESVEDAVRSEGWNRFVLKPAVSASGYETHALSLPLTGEAVSIVERVTAQSDVLLQPFIDEIPRDGEYSLMFIDGAFSHAAIKRAAEGEFRVQREHGGSAVHVEASPSLIAAASHSLAALPERPLYARVDGVMRDDTFMLVELELIEPNLFFELSPGSEARLAAALRDRLGQA